MLSDQMNQILVIQRVISGGVRQKKDGLFCSFLYNARVGEEASACHVIHHVLQCSQNHLTAQHQLNISMIALMTPQ